MIAIMDTETTGLTKPSFASLDDQPRIVEICVLLVENGKVVDEIDTVVNPLMKYPADLQKLTGITDDEISAAPTFEDIIDRLRKLYGKADMLYGHNVLFDKSLMTYELRRASCDFFPWPETVVCTVQEFRHIFGFRPNLTQLYEKIVGKPMVNAHRAKPDAMAVLEILNAMG